MAYKIYTIPWLQESPVTRLLQKKLFLHFINTKNLFVTLLYHNIKNSI